MRNPALRQGGADPSGGRRGCLLVEGEYKCHKEQRSGGSPTACLEQCRGGGSLQCVALIWLGLIV